MKDSRADILLIYTCAFVDVAVKEILATAKGSKNKASIS